MARFFPPVRGFSSVDLADWLIALMSSLEFPRRSSFVFRRLLVLAPPGTVIEVASLFLLAGFAARTP